MVKFTFSLVAISALCMLNGATAFVAQRPISRQFAALRMADAPETPTPVAAPVTDAAAAPAAATPEAAPAPADTAVTPAAKPAEPVEKQPLYGTTLNLPDTYARCGSCQTSFALTDDDLGASGRGRRLECSVCGHTWFQSRDRLMTMNEGFELVPLPEMDKNRVALNMEQGMPAKFMGHMKLYVGNIAFASREEDIFELFSEIGQVGDVALVRDDTGKNRGFGFVTMREKEDGEKAIAALDGQEVNGRNLAVRESSN